MKIRFLLLIVLILLVSTMVAAVTWSPQGNLLTLSILGGVNYALDNDVHYCEDKGLVMQCDKLSRYYSLENGKCWNSKVGNKLCRSGWLLVDNEVELIQVTPVKQIVPLSITNAQQYECDHNGCWVKT